MKPPAALPLVIDGLSSIAGTYDALICDIWGVVHNGQTPNITAIEALQEFRKKHGPVTLLSNAPRLAAHVRTQFDRLGVSHDCYDAISTSGEATRMELEKRAGGGAKLPIYHLGPKRDASLYEGLNINLVEPGAARLVLCTGLFDDENEGPDDYREVLANLHGLEMLCANPDVTVRRGDQVVYCAGAIAREYEKLGGRVIYFGKPHPLVFEAALAELRKRAPVKRVLVIGDGPATDILGANTMGLDALFIVGGLHGGEVADLATTAARAHLRNLFAQSGAQAKAMMTELRW